MATNICKPLKNGLVDHILKTFTIDPVTAEIRWKVDGKFKRAGDILPRHVHRSGGQNNRGSRISWLYSFQFGGKTCCIHGSRISFILYHGRDVTPGMLLDHKNGDAQNDSKENLRELTRSQNALNTRKAKRGKYGFYGVESVGGKFRGHIAWSDNGRTANKYSTERFDTPEEAARWFDRESISLRGEHARTNFPISDYIDIDAKAIKPKKSKFRGVTSSKDCFTSSFRYKGNHYYGGRFKSEREAFDATNQMRIALGAEPYQAPMGVTANV